MRSRRTVGAWALVVSVLAAWLLATVAVWAGLAPSVAEPEETVALGTSADLPTEDRQVVLVGIPGLTWDLVSSDTAPELVRLAREGGSAALVLRGTHEVTCEADAWLTVGAGQRAATDVERCGDAEGVGVEGVGVEGVGVEGGDVEVGDAQGTPETGAQTAIAETQIEEQRWRSWQEAAAGRALGPQLGTLAGLAEQGGTCVTAYGPPAVIGAADADGRAEVVLDAGKDPLSALEVAATGLSDCRIHLVSGPLVHPGDRSDVMPEVNAAVARLAESLPDGTTLLVAGLGHDSASGPDAQVLVAAPVGEHPGAAALTSGSTRQASLVQLTDLTPTLLSLAGVEVPSSARLAGEPVVAGPAVRGPFGGLFMGEQGAGEQKASDGAGGEVIAPARDLADGISWVKRVAPFVLGVLVAAALALLAVGAALFRWGGPRSRARRTGRVLILGAASFALAGPVATWLAGLLPWWRAGQPAVALLAGIALWTLVVAAVAWAGPWRAHPLAPPAVIGAITLVVVYVDVLWSARLGMVSVLGLQPITAGRFYGQGNVGLGIALGATLVLMAALLTWLRERPRQAAGAVAAIGVGAAVLNGAPTAGADFGGVPALVVATGLLILHALGIRWAWRPLLAVAVVGGLAAAALMVLDWLRGPERRTHLGGFVQSVLDGDAGGIIARKLSQNVGILLGYPIAWLVILLLVLVILVVVGRPSWSAGLWQHSGTRPVALAGVAAMVLAWLLNDSGLPAMGACLAVLIAAGLIVLARPEASPFRAVGPRPPGTVVGRRS
ncbi:hypothetical protein [Ornithinimicrobium pratense]|uniref:Uncharacterized protein n=1 Tax=Ornithinimicrobium pratense TaxID=2593973 RepID=A0A5J6V2T3_9MICO|nr:hypothetical protein [Ornithinimicrobium pratense]QFG67462.1 hypothetical protein FY030_00855 [Ornithinimicrobium pratense]